jgi:glycerol-3-phosphate dehydrogenase (NAD(P)+)
MGMSDRVAVIGAGSWGTAVAGLVGASHPTTLWVRSPELASSIERTRENDTYLSGVRLPDGLTATSSLEEAVAGAAVVFMAVPSHGFRAVLEDLTPFVSGIEAMVSLSKGIENGTNLRMSEVIAEVLPGVPAGVLTGPNLAQEVAQGQPAASVVALPDEELARRVQDLVHTRTFRVYMGTDVVGCEIAGASKNVMAIAAGICDGLGFGENTRAVLITRGLAELGRLGISLGGQVLTFGGLARRRIGGDLRQPQEPKSDRWLRAWPGPIIGRHRQRHAHGGRRCEERRTVGGIGQVTRSGDADRRAG